MDEWQEVDKGGWWDERWSQSMNGVSITRNNQCRWHKWACQNAKTPQDPIYTVTSSLQCFCWGTEMQNGMKKKKKKKKRKVSKNFGPAGRSQLMSQSPAPAKYCNYEVGIPDDAHPPLLHNQQRFAADPKNHKSSSCPLSHTCRLTQASQSAVCPADADWWRAALTRRMRGSSIKDGPGRPETGSYLQRNNTETTELPPSIINQEHVETLCVFMCVRVSCIDSNPDHPPALSLDFLFKIKAWGCRNSRSPFEVVKYTANCCQNRSIRWYLISAQA